MRKTGTYQLLGNINYFIPDPLPPTNPPLALSVEMMSLYGETAFILGKIDEIATQLPNQIRFIRAYIIKEALLSSAIENINTTLVNVFTSAVEADVKTNEDTQLVLNYSNAMNIALDMFQNKGIPISSRIILKMHETLLLQNRKHVSANPGSYRKQSVSIGALIPPPATEVSRLMGEVENFINEPSPLPAIIKAGLVHVQFETIHPFLDGNGRIGRMLIVLMLIESNILSFPIIYPSYYFKKHHQEYYQRLDQVRTKGDFEGWIYFYLNALKESAQDAYRRANEIIEIEKTTQQFILEDNRFIKNQNTALAVLNFLFGQPIAGISDISKQVKKTYNTVHNIVRLLIDAGFVEEITSRKRNKLYCFRLYLHALEKEY